MGIRVEFNPDLALRNIIEYKEGRRKIEECIPGQLSENEIYDFLKKDQRLYWLHGELPLRETKGGEVLSRPKASVQIIETTHFLDGGELWTKGKYKVIKLLNESDNYFEGYEKLITI